MQFFLKYRVILMYYKICYLSLSRSEKSWTQRCPGQHSVILGAIPESIQLDSALSGQHSDWPSTVSYSIQIDPALYRTAFSIQFNSSLFRTELSTTSYLFCDKEQTICSVTRNKHFGCYEYFRNTHFVCSIVVFDRYLAILKKVSISLC